MFRFALMALMLAASMATARADDHGVCTKDIDDGMARTHVRYGAVVPVKAADTLVFLPDGKAILHFDLQDALAERGQSVFPDISGSESFMRKVAAAANTNGAWAAFTAYSDLSRGALKIESADLEVQLFVDLVVGGRHICHALYPQDGPPQTVDRGKIPRLELKQFM